MNGTDFKRSPLFYVGDKFKLIPQLITLFPDNIENFYEPFTGGGSVPLNIKAKSYHLNDIDVNIVALHRLLYDYNDSQKVFFDEAQKVIARFGLSRSYESDIVPESIKKQWKKTFYARFNKEAYERLRHEYNTQDTRSVLYLYLLLIYGFNRMIRFNRSGNFNVPVGNVDFNPNVVKALESYFDWAGQADISWSNLDCIAFLKRHKFNSSDFTYLDPPYLITFSEYNKIWSERKEQELLTQLDEMHQNGARFAISNVTHYKGRVNTIFSDWAGQYTIHPIKSNYISYHDNSVKDFREVLVTNYA